MPDPFVTPWTVDCQSPLSMIFPRQELEWVAICFSRASFWPRDWTHWQADSSHWATREAQPLNRGSNLRLKQIYYVNNPVYHYNNFTIIQGHWYTIVNWIKLELSYSQHSSSRHTYTHAHNRPKDCLTNIFEVKQLS